MKTTLIALTAFMILAGSTRADEISEKAQAKAAIWPMEQAIYAGRAKGDMTAYIENTSPGYMAWPPQAARPMGDAVLKATAAGVPKTSKERLTLQFVDLAVYGDTAVIYYTTYRTQQFDGSPTDQHYETAHTWVRENGQWKVLGGMARIEPKR